MGIPVTIVSGFLGSGKTTLINQVLATTTKAKEKIIIIENEFGEVGLDHELLIHSKDKIFQMNNGCVCCSLRTDLVAALQAILDVFLEKGLSVEQVIIETTGIADPQPIIQTILTTPILSDYFFIDSIFTVVDVANYESTYQIPEATKQIVLADRLFLAEKEGTIQTAQKELIKQLAAINPLADAVSFSLAEPVQATAFFDLELFHETNEQLLVAPEHDDHDHEHGHHHEHAHHHENHGFESIHLIAKRPMKKSLFLQWLDWLLYTNQGNLFRFKGFVSFVDQELAMTVQGVNQQVAFNLSHYSVKECQTSLILIGKELPVERIVQAFEKLQTYSQVVK